MKGSSFCAGWGTTCEKWVGETARVGCRGWRGRPSLTRVDHHKDRRQSAAADGRSSAADPGRLSANLASREYKLNGLLVRHLPTSGQRSAIKLNQPPQSTHPMTDGPTLLWGDPRITVLLHAQEVCRFSEHLFQKGVVCRNCRDPGCLACPPSYMNKPCSACARCLETHRIAAGVLSLAGVSPGTLAVPLTIRRVALVLALPVLDTSPGPASKGPGDKSCTWCNGSICDTSDPGPLQSLCCEGPFHGVPICTLHEGCWAAVKGHVCSVWVDRCMASCVAQLPLLPEVRHLIAAIVCQLSGVGVEAAAAQQCPVWVARV